ncbi:MAG: amidohydrolase [Spirochaetaceae bacterium]|jgi:amidohydrolase|nr:amidohydrolase [Spirochaetaceae bacterium]
MNADELQQTLEGHFRHLHRHPELSFKEYETTAYIKRSLEEAGVEVLDTGLETGLVARVRGNGGGKKVALRADIDAIPVSEATGLAWASENPGVMHACGHDFHTAGLLGAAMLLNEKKSGLDGEVLLVFQPAEEVSGGAASVLKTGVLDGVQEIYGLHTAPDYESGVVALKAGGTFAAVAAFKITITGKGGHAAMPHLCHDPVYAQAALITGAQSIISRNSDPFAPVVLSFTHVEAGKTWNVIPPRAFVEGTIRALSTEKARHTVQRLSALCRGLDAHEVTAEIDWWMDAPATNNNAELTRFAENTARELGFTVTEYTPTMAGEDFALYQEKIPGVFINFGVGSPHGLHHPEYRADPAGLASAARLLAALAEKTLQDCRA